MRGMTKKRLDEYLDEYLWRSWFFPPKTSVAKYMGGLVKALQESRISVCYYLRILVNRHTDDSDATECAELDINLAAGREAVVATTSHDWIQLAVSKVAVLSLKEECGAGEVAGSDTNNEHHYRGDHAASSDATYGQNHRWMSAALSLLLCIIIEAS
ncbi:hypothetical protein L914_10457 [Phytophthora nicotianae]|uniref:Uncharacterized protein n=1 Tax=Phytophthora nicotianae TaxID=4792 RepID=W2N9D6_PHYNI|nr:hypothetical protein L914_10457 [Phytophthora nicotianae]